MIVILDNNSVHTGGLVKAKLKQWKKRLCIFFY